MPNRVTVTTIVVAVLLTSACGPSQDATTFAEGLRDKVTTNGIVEHLRRFQDIANRYGGNRHTGSQGYEHSVDYVSDLLRQRGFDVSIDEFDAGIFSVATESLVVDGARAATQAVEYSASSPAAGVRGPLVSAPDDGSPGCTASDYDGSRVDGAVVVARRGGCYLSDKAAAAADRGALALVIVNDVDEKAFSAGLLEEDRVQIPVLSVSKAEGAGLVGHQGTAAVQVDARIEQRRVRSVLAQTRTGSTSDVVMVGAHLDSVRSGPGINDDASGVAVALETAVQMGAEPPIAHAVRFAFWGGEEQWMLGSDHFVAALDESALASIELYLNFDMVASPNAGFLVLDSDGTLPPDPEAGVSPPQGSEAIERAFVDYLDGRAVTSDALPFDGRGDWNSFARVGIPVGALCTGNEGVKTERQAELWGGTAGKPFDPNYHSSDDTIANVNRSALDVTGPAIAYVVGLYAQAAADRYAVPPQQDRTRHVLQPR